MKRQRTRQRIHEAALDLVEARGLDNTTVEDICHAADISRRTFFNYMDSKDHAVFGVFPLRLTEDGLDAIANTQSDNLPQLILTAFEEDPAAPDRSLLARQRALIQANMELESAALIRKREALGAVWRAVEKHFAQFPQDRKLDGPAEEEIHTIVEIVFCAISHYLHLPQPKEGTTTSHLLRAGATFTAFAKELEWKTTA